MNVLIDSSIIIDHLRSFHRTKNTKLISIYRKSEAVYFSVITIGEIFSGLSASDMEDEIRGIFSLGQIIDLNALLMEEAGKIRRETKISLIDAIIAACALELDIPVATLNIKDFSRVRRLKIYSLTK